MTRDPFRRVNFGGFGLGGPVPPDLVVLLAVLLTTSSLHFFDATRWIPALLELSSASWRQLEVWRVVTYPFIGVVMNGFWFLVGLLFLYSFGRDAFFGLGRKHFWRMILWSAIGGALVAIATDLLFARMLPAGALYLLMQGQLFLFAVFFAAFGTAHRDATILIFFVIPMPARWCIPLEILGAFMGFLFTHDLAGFLGLCAAMGLTAFYLRSGGSVGGGRRRLREIRLRIERWWLQRRLDRNRKKRGFRVISGEGQRGDGEVRKGPWVH